MRITALTSAALIASISFANIAIGAIGAGYLNANGTLIKDKASFERAKTICLGEAAAADNSAGNASPEGFNPFTAFTNEYHRADRKSHDRLHDALWILIQSNRTMTGPEYRAGSRRPNVALAGQTPSSPVTRSVTQSWFETFNEAEKLGVSI
jgi:hypothetical protein